MIFGRDIEHVEICACWKYVLPVQQKAGHTFFKCPMWAPERQQAKRIIGHVTPTTIVGSMLENEGNWEAVETMMRKIMGKKESHERSRHMQNELRIE
ncbi:hypothetical protein Trydic_g13879 [Trypoxylus dichotomus]